MSGVWNAVPQGRRRVNLFGRAAMLLGFVFVAISLITLNVNAASNPFKITDAAITAKSAGVDASIDGFEDTKINASAAFHQKDESITYSITLKNTSDSDFTISEITDDNSNSYLSYTYDPHAGEVVAAGADLVLEVTVTYAAEISGLEARIQDFVVKFSLGYEGEDDNIAVPDTSEGAAAPDTGAATHDNSKAAPTIILTIVGAILLSIGIFKSKFNGKTKIAALMILCATATGSIASATKENFTFEFANNYSLKSLLSVNINGEETTIEYGGTLPSAPVAPQKDGYNPDGWKNKDDGTPFNPTAPIYDDVDIEPSYRPIEYVVAIDTDGDGNPDSTIYATYDYPFNLPDNENTKPGHTPNGWTDGQHHYDDGENSNLTTTDGATINLSPDFTPNQYTVNIDTNGDGTTDQTLDVTYGETVNLPTNQAEKTGYSPNGWTDGTTHYDNGADISGLLIDDGGEITLSPDWVRNQYTISLDVGEGTLADGNELEGYYGDEVTLPTPTAPAGKKFIGWYDDEDNKLDSTVTITDTATVYAHYRELATEAEWWNGSLNNMYMKELNANATTFKHYATDPQPDDIYSTDKYKVVSAPESPAKIYLWQDENDEDVINWWTEATTIRLHHQYANDMFNGVSKLKNIDFSGIDTSTTTSFANFFNGTAIESIDLSDWDTSSLTNMANMFSECGQLKTVTFGSDFDTSKVTNMSGLFDGTTNLQSVDTENLDTEKVRNMAFMFRSSGISTLDLSNFYTPALTNAQLMFSGATNLTTIYASTDFDLSHVTGTDYHNLAYDYNMFMNTDSLAGGAGTAFSSSNPRNKTYARIDDPGNDAPGYFTLKDARYIEYDGNGADNSQHETMTSHYLTNTGSLKANAFVRDEYAFIGWNTEADGSGTSYANRQTMSDLVESSTPLTLYAQWGTYALLDTGPNVNAKMKGLAGAADPTHYTGDTNIKAIERASALPSGFDTDDTAKILSTENSPTKIYAWYDDSDRDDDGEGDNVIYVYSDADILKGNANMSHAFAFMESVTSLPILDYIDTSGATDMNSMFRGAQALTSLVFPGSFDTSNVTNMTLMFASTTALTSLTLPESFNTSSVIYMGEMFSRATSLTSLTLPSTFDTSNVISMWSMFYYMTSLTSLTLPDAFNTANVTDMRSMFNGMESLTSLTFPAAFDTSNVTNMHSMFDGMKSLTSLTLPSTFKTPNLVDMQYMFRNMSALTSLTIPNTFDTSQITRMDCVFEGMESLTSLTLPDSFNTSNVTHWGSTFSGMKSLTSLTLPDSFVIKSGATVMSPFRYIKNTATLYAADPTVRSLWPGVLGN